MSSIRHALFTLAIAPLLCAQNNSGAAFGCPASIGLNETASVSAPWRAESGKSEHKFLRPSIYNGNPGKEEYELAPDNTQTTGKQVKQTWRISDYRDHNVFVRCRYENTTATVVSDVPRRIKTCAFSFHNKGGNQPVESPVFGCQ